MTKLKISLALASALGALSAGTAYAQSTFGSGTPATVEGTATTSTVNGTSTTATTGDSTTAPFQNTTTTVQNQTVNSTTPSTTESFTTTVNGVTYTNGTVTASGTGTQNQTSTTSLLNTYNPGPPPTLISSVPSGPVVTPVGSPSVTAVSAAGSVGDANHFRADLTTSGTPTAAGSVVATENSVAITSSGVVFSQRVGTATYDPTSGDISIALPSAPTSSATVSATGIVAGPVSLTNTGINAGGFVVSNVAAGVATTDAVNVGQLNALSSSLNSSLSSFQSSVNASLNAMNARLDEFEEESNAATAVAIALGGGAFLPDKKFNITVNYGNYEGESAIAGQVGVLVNESVALNAGIATGFDNGGTGFRVGGSFGF